MLTPDTLYAAACLSFRQRFSERLEPVHALPESAAAIDALNRSIDLTLTNLREQERHFATISLFYEQVDSLPIREKTWREEYAQWLSNNTRSANDDVQSEEQSAKASTCVPEAIPRQHQSPQTALPPPLYYQREKLNELWHAFQSCGFEFGRDVGSRLAANIRLTGVTPWLYVYPKDRRKVLRLEVTRLRILRRQTELLQPSSTASDPFASGVVASFAAHARQVRDISTMSIEVLERLWSRINQPASPAGSGIGYRPGKLAELLKLSADRLNHWAKLAGVKTPGRGKREFVYPPSDVLKICQTIVDGGANELTRSTATALLKAEQSRTTSTKPEPGA